MKKVIIIEGLPGVGKTTLVNFIKKQNIPNVTIIDEIVNEKIIVDGIYTEDEFIENDIEKINRIKQGIVIMDRGIISSLSYSQMKSVMDTSYNIRKAIDLFDKYKYILEECKIIYLTNRLKKLKITGPYDSPYGSKESQELLEEISLYNIKKYCKNYIIKEYYQENMEDIINEIID